MQRQRRNSRKRHLVLPAPSLPGICYGTGCQMQSPRPRTSISLGTRGWTEILLYEDGRKAKHSDLVTSQIRSNKPVLSWYLPTDPYPLTLDEVLSRYAKHLFWLGLCDAKICRRSVALSHRSPLISGSPFFAGKMLDQSYRPWRWSLRDRQRSLGGMSWGAGCITWKSPMSSWVAMSFLELPSSNQTWHWNIPCGWRFK